MILFLAKRTLLSVNTSRYLNSRPSPGERPVCEFWLYLTVPYAVYSDKFTFYLQTSSLKNAFERLTQRRISWGERRGPNQPIHSIVRKECIQILDAIYAENSMIRASSLC